MISRYNGSVGLPPQSEQTDVRLGTWGRLTRVRRALRGLSDVIVPPTCLSCRQPLTDHDALCAACWSKIDFIRPPVCDRLGIPLPFATGDVSLSAAAIAHPPVWGRARAVAHHSNQMRRLVHELKFHDCDDLVRLLGGLLATCGQELIADADLVVPVPLARLRLLMRRFNQAARLAAEVAARSGLRFDPLSLQRTRATETQIGKTRNERIANVRGAFAVAPARRERIAGQRILLIDDVITTGATVTAAARALFDAGAEQVDVLALALATGAEDT